MKIVINIEQLIIVNSDFKMPINGRNIFLKCMPEEKDSQNNVKYCQAKNVSYKTSFK